MKRPKLITRVQIKFHDRPSIVLTPNIEVKSRMAYERELRVKYPDCKSILMTYNEKEG